MTRLDEDASEAELRAADDNLTAKYLQGLLMGMCMNENMQVQQTMGVVDVLQEQDAEGNYLPWFTVTFKSGAKVVVMVSPLPTKTHI